MMYQKKSGPSAWLKYALALPVLLLLTVAFARQINKDAPETVKALEASTSTDPDDIFKVVEQMPMFPSKECEGIADHKERKSCADQALLTYLYENMKYPKNARKDGIQGRVYVQFVVEKDGSITRPKILRDIGGGCGEEAQRVVMSMNDIDPWSPGYQRGKAVRVYYTLPVVFKLNEDGPEHLHNPPPPPAPAAGDKQISNIPPPPPPPSQKAKQIEGPNEIFKVVEKMPIFPSKECAGIADHKERKGCADKALLNYIAENVKYPKAAMKEGIQGRAYVKFVIEKDGSVTNAEIMRDIGGGCGEEAKRVVMAMNDLDPWTPGYQRGKAVRVSYLIPVAFKLDENYPEPKPCNTVDYDTGLPSDVYKMVDIMPTFPACDDVEDQKEHKACSDMALLKYLYTNVKYPEDARKDGIQGRVYVQFVVNTDGLLSDLKVARSPHESLSNEVLRVTESMNHMDKRWSPGIKDGKAVKVIYTMPVVFKLEDNTSADGADKEAKSTKPTALQIDKTVLRQSGQLTFALEAVSTSADVQLMTIDGRVLHTAKVQTQKGMNKISLDMGSISTGIYVLKVDSGDQSITKKISAQ